LLSWQVGSASRLSASLFSRSLASADMNSGAKIKAYSLLQSILTDKEPTAWFVEPIGQFDVGGCSTKVALLIPKMSGKVEGVALWYSRSLEKGERNGTIQ